MQQESILLIAREQASGQFLSSKNNTKKIKSLKKSAWLSLFSES
jgi:hypothetical protein